MHPTQPANMQSEKLSTLVEDRREWVEVNQKNGFDFDSILAGQYDDPSHFIYELLQNAEDAHATTVSFELSEDELIVRHDGRDFDFDDIDAVTGVGKSTKENDFNKIGKFGLGFKSVFAVTKTPRVYSGPFSIEIESFVVPIPLESDEEFGGTRISLPFNHNSRSSKAVFDLVRQKIQNLETASLLFLSSIKEIKWKTPSSQGHYYKESEKVGLARTARRVSVISQSASKDRFEKYLVFRKPFHIEETVDIELGVEVAYKLIQSEEGHERIEPVSDSKLVVFFPTQKETHLGFLMQGPYKTTPNRESIPLSDDTNKRILGVTADLVAETIHAVKDMGLLDIAFLSTLPLDDPDERKGLIYAEIHQRAKEELFSENKLLPTSEGGYASSKQILLAGVRELPSLLDADDTEALFGRAHWLDTAITQNQTSKIYAYVTEQLEIEEVTFRRFSRQLTIDFLESKPDDWLTSFYASLQNRGALWRERRGRQRRGSRPLLRTKPIIRTADNDHIAPFDRGGNLKVFLPTVGTSEYPSVKPSLLEDEHARSFLQELGLKEPDLLAEIHRFVAPRYGKKSDPEVTTAKYLDDFGKVLEAWKQLSAGKEKRRFVEEIKSRRFVYALDQHTGQKCFRKPTEVYLNTSELRRYFASCEAAYFVADEVREKYGSDDEWAAFLDELGVASSPRRRRISADLSDEEKRKMRGGKPRTADKKEIDYELEGLSAYLRGEVTYERSLLLWNVLSKAIGSNSHRSFFKGKYTWYYYNDKSRHFDASFFELLKSERWLFAESHDCRKPSSLTRAQLNGGYSKQGNGPEALLKALPFKSDAEERLPGERRRVLSIVDSYGVSPDELDDILRERKPSTNLGDRAEEEENWTPDVQPGAAGTSASEEILPDKTQSPDLSYQPGPEGKNRHEGKGGKNDPDAQRSSQVEEEPQIEATRSSREVGEWGERHVLEKLKKEHAGEELDVRWLNEEGDVARGYDFTVEEDGREIEYIEVKSTRSEGNGWIDISGTQWEFARRLAREGRGDQYWLYVVSNAGTSQVQVRKLRNPIQLWKDGRLWAHPIKFRVPSGETRNASL